jgi:ligand-binding SRPBCC domain-containing protein
MFSLLRFPASSETPWSLVISNNGSGTKTIGCRPTPSRCGNAFYSLLGICARVSRQGRKLKTEIFIHRSRIEASAAAVYAWHALPSALEKLTPPGDHVKIIKRTGGIERGARVLMQFGRWPFRMRWVAEHQGFQVGRYFSDYQVSGPFAFWRHTHTFEPAGPSACILEDKVEYALPLGFIGRWVAGKYVRDKIAKLFEYRHAVTAHDVVASHKSN